MSWSVIIPAAGKGSRLGGGTKLLYPVAGKPILEWLLPVLDFGEIIFVLSPEGAEQFLSRLPHNAMCKLQKQPIGMANAVSLGLEEVTNDKVCVIWGDQIIFSKDLIPRGKAILGLLNYDMCCPVAIQNNPYTHLCRQDGKIVDVRLRRENDPMPDIGESDVGVFFFRTVALRTAFNYEGMRIPGRLTGECNFLPILTVFNKQVSITAQPDDVIGINTLEDVKRAEELCRSKLLCSLVETEQLL